METASPQVKQHRRALVAGSVGNFIEWYEFAIYGFLATLIAQNFFQLQGESALSGLILTWASFAVAFSFGHWVRWCLVELATASDVNPR